jgi:hypothetical protein
MIGGQLQDGIPVPLLGRCAQDSIEASFTAGISV